MSAPTTPLRFLLGRLQPGTRQGWRCIVSAARHRQGQRERLMSATTRWLTALLFAVAVGAGHLLEGPDEATTARLVAADKADAIGRAASDRTEAFADALTAASAQLRR